MLVVSVVAVLLTAAPGHASLLESAEPDLRHPARLLAQDTSQPPADAPISAPASPDERIRELTLQLDALDARILDLHGSGPTALVVTGFILSPALPAGLFLLFLGLAYTDYVGELILPAVALTATGVGAVAMILHGFNLKEQRRTELSRLTAERNALDREVERLRRSQLPPPRSWGPPVRPSRTVPVLAFRF